MKPKPALPASQSTTFMNGDQFVATATVQGMVADKRYIVIDKNERATVFGNFVAYLVNEVADGTPFWVKNLHLLATRVPTADELATTTVIEAIAKQHLGVATLNARKSDRLDFYEVNVESLRTALEAAFHAGAVSAQKRG